MRLTRLYPQLEHIYPPTTNVAFLTGVIIVEAKAALARVREAAAAALQTQQETARFLDNNSLNVEDDAPPSPPLAPVDRDSVAANIAHASGCVFKKTTPRPKQLEGVEQLVFEAARERVQLQLLASTTAPAARELVQLELLASEFSSSC